MSYDDFSDQQIKHMEMIQAVIARLGSDSFLVKGWAITLTGAFVGFGIQGEIPELALAGLLPAFLFWGLDAYFLRAERLFRVLYDRVRLGQAVEPFFLSATSKPFVEATAKASWKGTLFSWTLNLFYGTLVVSTLVVAGLL